jgi:hypothetical protein
MHDFEPHSLKEQIAAAAAAMVVEEGLEYGPAKRRALKQLGLPLALTPRTQTTSKPVAVSPCGTEQTGRTS